MIDQNLVSFDLAEPLDTYQLAISIHRIYLAQHAHLKEILTPECIGRLRDTVGSGKVLPWTMTEPVAKGGDVDD